MFKKTIVFAATAVMALAMIVSGCGRSEVSSIVMDTSNEKKADIKFSTAKEDEFVLGGYISVAEGEEIEIVSDLNDGGEVLIGFIAAADEQNISEIPDMENANYEMMISGAAAQSCTVAPGEYDLKVTVQSKATGTVTLTVKPSESAKAETMLIASR